MKGGETQAQRARANVIGIDYDITPASQGGKRTMWRSKRIRGNSKKGQRPREQEWKELMYIYRGTENRNKGHTIVQECKDVKGDDCTHELKA